MSYRSRENSQRFTFKVEHLKNEWFGAEKKSEKKNGVAASDNFEIIGHATQAIAKREP